MTPVAGHADQAYSIVSNEFHQPWVMVVYILGLLCTAWHLGYGIFLIAIDWGLVIGQKAQKIALYACLGLVAFLGVTGINAAFGFVRPCGLMPNSLCAEPRLTTDRPPQGSGKL